MEEVFSLRSQKAGVPKLSIVNSTLTGFGEENPGEKDLDLFLIPIHVTTYVTSLAKVKIDRRAKNQGQRTKGSNRRAPTDKRTQAHTRTLPNVLSPLPRGR